MDSKIHWQILFVINIYSNAFYHCHILGATYTLHKRSVKTLSRIRLESNHCTAKQPHSTMKWSKKGEERGKQQPGSGRMVTTVIVAFRQWPQLFYILLGMWDRENVNVSRSIRNLVQWAKFSKNSTKTYQKEKDIYYFIVQ